MPQIFQDGSYNKGSFKEDRFDGPGCYFNSKRKHVFVGVYSRHDKNGMGTYYEANGDRLKCTWIAGERNGFCKNYQGDMVSASITLI